MADYYHFELEFDGVDFNKYYYGDPVEALHHTHLFIHENEIELRVYFKNNTNMDERMGGWIGNISRIDFGKYLKVHKAEQNARVTKIDFSGAKMLGMSFGTSYKDLGNSYFIIKVSKVKMYWTPIPDLIEANTADFYLPESGFKVVKQFYSILYGSDGVFKINRNSGHRFFSLGSSKFRPEFETYSNDDMSSPIATVKKIPKVKFKYPKPITEEDALFYWDVFSVISSFYFHMRIDYSTVQIHFPEHSISIKNVIDPKVIDRDGNLFGVGIYSDFPSFLNLAWQTHSISNFKKLSKAVDLFNQANSIDSNSEFLVRYNIIELCDDIKYVSDKFNFNLKKKAKKKKYDDALKILLDMINPDEQEMFKRKWEFTSSKLDHKPMRSTLVTFIESQGLDSSKFPISLEDLKKLRDRITHGSISEIDSESVRKANQFLCRINTILILNLMGIKSWHLITELK